MPRPQHPFTTHGISRAGDEFQDLWGIELLLEWLEHPDRYDWVRFECDDMGALDDVVARRREGGLVCRQMKHTPEPDRPDLAASWEWLMKQKAGKSGPLPSLLQHWADALDRQLDGEGIVEAGLFTNRRPDGDVTAVWIGKRIDFDSIADADLQQNITDQLGGADRARAFFQRFDFNLDYPSYDVFEQSLMRRFRQSLGGTELGWASLRAAARDWALRKDRAGPEGRITLQDVHHAALWQQLHALSQDFAVPEDYVVPDPDMRDTLVAELRTSGKGTTVIAAGPGYGKSTFLSHLVGHLAEQGVPAIRHHYYMAARERAEDRFSHQVVLEALMAQLLRHHAALLGPFAERNPAVSDFGSWLTAAGDAASERCTALVVVIDGLDHVWREQGASTELERLFTHLLPPPQGVRLVIGTQPLEGDAALPACLLRHARRDSWRPLPLLTEVAVRELLRRNQHRLTGAGHGSADFHHLDEAAIAFHQLTHGHPLHLRYSLESLIASGIPAFPWNIEALPACPTGEIESYYDALCRNVGETARRQLHLFAATSFPWPSAGLRQVVDPAGLRTDETRSALRSIRHLFQETPLGLVPFHASLTLHLRRVPEHEEYRNELLDHVINWLAGRAPEPWRWAYRWTVAADHGNQEDVVAGPDEDWLAQAIADRRPSDQVSRILAKGSQCALASDDLPRTVELTLLADYAERAQDPVIFDLTPLTACALQSGRRFDLIREMRAGLSRLPAREMVALVEAEIGGAGAPALVDACLDVIRTRSAALSDRLYSSSDEWRPLEDAVPWLLGYRRSAPTEHGVTAIRGSGNNGGPSFLAFLTARAKLGWWTDLPEVLVLLQEDTDRHELAIGAFRHASAEGIDWLGWSDQPEWCQSAMALAFRLANRDKPAPDLPPLLPWSAPAVDPMVFVQGGRRLAALDLHRIFFSNLICGWLETAAADLTDWEGPDRRAMAEAGYEIGRRLKAGAPLDLMTLFPALPRVVQQPGEHIVNTRWRERDVRRAGAEIVIDLIMMRGLMGGEARISEQEVAALLAAPVEWRQAFRDALLNSRLALLSPQALSRAIDHECDRLSHELCQLPVRYEDYARLAWLANLHKAKPLEIEQLCVLAARCTVGYGFHKDILLSDTMLELEAAADILPHHVQKWMKRLAPFVDAVTDFTDGDETAHNKAGMGDLLLKLAPHLVAPYIRHLVARGDRYRADQVMAMYIPMADLAADETKELMRSAGGKESYEALSARRQEEKSTKPHAGDQSIVGSANISGAIKGIALVAPAEEPPPDVAIFPPDRFKEFQNAVSSRFGADEKALVLSWFQHWTARDLDGALQALARSVDDDPFPVSMTLALVEAIRVISPRAGREAAFDWLVRAHKAAMGWSSYFSAEEVAQSVWDELRQTYPNRWLDFIQATTRLEHGGKTGSAPAFIGQSRLIAFLLRMGQPEQAAAVIDRQVAVLLQRTADLPLTMPAWADGLHV